jgi:hypothetical protein
MAAERGHLWPTPARHVRKQKERLALPRRSDRYVARGAFGRTRNVRADCVREDGPEPFGGRPGTGLRVVDRHHRELA